MQALAVAVAVAIACLVAHPAAGSQAEPSPAPGWQPVQGPDYRGVIVPAADAPDFFWVVNGEQYEARWTPAANQVADLEAALEPAFAALPSSLVSGADLATYHRQYGGFIANDRHLIRISFFCDAFFRHVEPYWQSRTVFAAGGGACFFRLTYDPATGAFSDLDVNGPI
ncbi:MAG: hypothetical protein ACRDJW_24260 [Thermomicrobiales bacterium]